MIKNRSNRPIQKNCYLITFCSFDFHKLSVLELLSPEGVAVDWVSRRIYWTDSKKDTIEASSIENSENRVIIISDDLINPRGIAVDPSRG